MSVQITLSIPDHLAEHAKRVGSATQRDTAEVLADALQVLWPTLPDASESYFPAVETLTDLEVLELAEIKMAQTQNERLGELQAKGKQGKLTEAEQYELLALLQVYQLGHLRKSEALAEAVKRGLRPSLQ